MIKFRNNLTGSIMWVTDDRADEYRKLGHKEVDTPSEKPIKKSVEIPKTEKKTSRRTSSKEAKERW